MIGTPIVSARDGVISDLDAPNVANVEAAPISFGRLVVVQPAVAGRGRTLVSVELAPFIAQLLDQLL
ncbi:hypothetical protein [Actinophytocola sp.]|jgi:hypothetical protein|uniref:hypothetical protein n=1 Tax=Actinophytocola sp. TaxID=1872138 RepID=UPI002E194074